MTDCKGLFGKWFGHKFKTYLIEYGPASSFNLSNCSFFEAKTLLKYSMSKKYEIRCKRCGCKIDD